MRLLILGATGPSGVLLIRETLQAYKQCTVVIYARAPEKLPQDLASHDSLVIIKGELTDPDALEKAVEGVDVVLSALGPVPGNKGETPVAKGYLLLIEIMKKRNVNRIILLGTGSIKDPNDKSSWKYASLIWGVSTFFSAAYADIVATGDAIRNEGADLDWTIVRVPILTDKDSKDVNVGYIGDGKDGLTLSRKAFAAFVAGEVEKREWVKKAPLISSP